ncbi:MAG TPA: HAD family phosphatase [Candidatus Methylomirabilis sp.]|nr:HAD family phosphatase [Candidatus Methylomirabilis sp.]
MLPTKLRAIIFDIGRVIIRVDVGRAMQGLAASSSLSAAELWSAIEKDPRWHDWQEGRIASHDWHLHLTRKLGGGLSFEQFTEAWNRALDPAPMQDDALFEQLAKHYRLALLSNTDPIHVGHMESAYSFFKFFRARIYSCSVGTSKPNPLIYGEALRALKVKAEEAVYIDDVAAYVEAARRLGMSGIQFQSSGQLVADLGSLGILTPQSFEKTQGTPKTAS